MNLANKFHDWKHRSKSLIHIVVIVLAAVWRTDEAWGQKDYKICFYKNGSVVNERLCIQTDSITLAPQDGNGYMLFWSGGVPTIVAQHEVDSIKIEDIIVPPAQPEGKTIVFAEGVSRDGGWYDVNKVGRGENGDINMCWAASASNIIQWWQDRYVAAGNELPQGAISGPGETYELALMELFHEQWWNQKGGHVVEAVPWYFEGVFYGENASAGSQAYPYAGCEGGYFKTVWNDIYPHLYHEYTYMFDWYKGLYAGDFNNYYLWGNGTSLQGKERLRAFTQYVVDFIDRGITSMTVALSSDLRTLHHATTVWGYEIDNESGLLTRLWITDSDDLETEPKQPLLNEYEVSVGEGKSHIKLTSQHVRYGACYVVALTPVSGYKATGR